MSVPYYPSFHAINRANATLILFNITKCFENWCSLWPIPRLSWVGADLSLNAAVISLMILNQSSLCGRQCDQIGRFLKVLGNTISSKISPNDCQLFGKC